MQQSISTDVKLSKAQISKLNQSGRFLGSCLSKLGKKVATDLSISFGRDKLPELVSNMASNAALNLINKFQIKQLKKEP